MFKLKFIWLRACRKKLIMVTAISLLITGSSIKAQPQINYAVHANIIYRFTKYIDWPDEMKSGDFIIGIIGDTPLFDVLNNFIRNKMAGSQRIIIKRFDRSEMAFDCHILFVAEDASSSMKKIASRIADSPTLIVSESEALQNKWSCINFVIVHEHLQLEINTKNIAHRRLNIANELLNLGMVR